MAISRTFFLRFAASAALLLACSGLPGLARAQTAAADNSRATDLFKNGKQAFGRGDMVEAEKLFSEAWAIRRSSDIAANLGQSELEQKKFRSAAEHFAWALANLLPSATDAQRKAVETGLGKARSEIGVLRLNVKPDGAAVLVGEQNLGTAPVGRSVYVDPGEVLVSVKLDGYVSIEKRLMVGKGTEQAVDMELSPDAAALQPASGPVGSGLGSNAAAVEAAPPAQDHPGQKSLVPAYVATGVAVAGGVTGLVFRVSASSKETEADTLQGSLEAGSAPDAGPPCGASAPPPDCEKLKRQRGSVDSSRNLALGAFIIGGVAAVAAGYFYWDALSGRGGSGSARRTVPRWKVLPSLAVTPSGSAEASSPFHSVKLGLSGKF